MFKIALLSAAAFVAAVPAHAVTPIIFAFDTLAGSPTGGQYEYQFSFVLPDFPSTTSLTDISSAQCNSTYLPNATTCKGTIDGNGLINATFFDRNANGLASVQKTFIPFDHVGSYLAGSRDAAVTITAVPEPASWALMIAGFGMVGASLRARRTAVRFA